MPAMGATLALRLAEGQANLGKLLGGDGDPARAGRLMQAMLQMNKLDLHELRHAYDGA